MESIERVKKPTVMDTVYERAREAFATVAIADAEDPRVQEAAEKIEAQGLAKIILLDVHYFSSLPESEQTELAEIVRSSETKREMTTEQAHELLSKDTRYLAAALVKAGKADGFVAGSKCETRETIRPALRILGTSEGYASSFQLMLVPGKEPLIYADCAFNVQPDSSQLARIAIDTAHNVRSIGITPRVAFISFSTKGSASHPMVSKVQDAIKEARSLDPSIAISEHELQIDAALNPMTAQSKKVYEGTSGVPGHANVLIFSDINTGNAVYKADQENAKAQAIGPIFQGFKYPVNDLSRGCTTQDIVDVVAFTAMQAGAKKNTL